MHRVLLFVLDIKLCWVASHACTVGNEEAKNLAASINNNLETSLGL